MTENTEERWLPIPWKPYTKNAWVTSYEVSDQGRYRRLKDGSPQPPKIGTPMGSKGRAKGGGKARKTRRIGHYLKATFLTDELVGIRNPPGKTVKIHALVARLFIPGPWAADAEVHHINGDHADNRVANLRYLTPEEHRHEHESMDLGVPRLLSPERLTYAPNS